MDDLVYTGTVPYMAFQPVKAVAGELQGGFNVCGESERVLKNGQGIFL
jgi:hypothetical protein